MLSLLMIIFLKGDFDKCLFLDTLHLCRFYDALIIFTDLFLYYKHRIEIK